MNGNLLVVRSASYLVIPASNQWKAGEEDSGLKGDRSMVSISEKGHKELESHTVGTHKQTKAVEPTRKATTHTTHQRWDENGNPKQKGDQVADNEDGVPTGVVGKVANAEGKPSQRTEGQGSEEEEVRILKRKSQGGLSTFGHGE
ncbi:hypothetical protein OIU84_007846 [Salix udensis]|uniref:Uncharacterized protein n=1 Tax=Salix udensis TaxID=889485 RepID=A0AAD6JTR6_9ROSI|nr:hypothetical protein OIU84_007846 [Salix udensis]